MSSASEPIRAVVDTNLLVSGAILKRGNPLRLVEAWTDGKFRFLISAPILLEYRQVLQRPRLLAKYVVTPTDVAEFLDLLTTKGDTVMPASNLPVTVRDPTDEPFLAAAFGGNADYLVTGDKDLLVLANDPGLGNLHIVSVAAFLAVLQEQ